MPRQYNSRRRTESAERTRQAIIEAAVKLHGMEVTTVAAVAEEAGVSLPTVTKYFPTREDLFMACTNHMAEQMQFVSIEELRAIDGAGERLRRIVQEVYRLHEMSFGHSWVGYTMEDESAVMRETMRNYEGIAAMMVDTLPYQQAISDEDTMKRFVRAALNPLTYRAMRLKNGLTMEQAVQHMTSALAGVLNIVL